MSDIIVNTVVAYLKIHIMTKPLKKQANLIPFVFVSESFVAGHQSTTKQHVELPLADQEQCIRKYQTLGIPISADQLCAGGVYAQDTCEGDSGNALMRLVSNAWVIEGVVSFGRGCGLQDWPAVYTRVSNYVDWIQRNMRP